MNIAAITLVTLVFRFIQTVTGFGAGIFNMIVLPFFFGINVSTGISGLVTILLTVALAFHYRQYISYRKVILPVDILTLIIIGIFFCLLWQKSRNGLCR